MAFILRRALFICDYQSPPRSDSECGKNDKKGICTGSKEFEFLIEKTKQ
jgi:hypothetical protein